MPADVDTKEAPSPVGLPLFYERPQALQAAVHGDLRISARPDFRFAATTNAVPVMASEFAVSARHYPIVFTGEMAVPMAVLGLRSKNIFVTEDGQWDGLRTYIPAYVRRYPFTFIQAGDRFILGVDLACERLISSGRGHKSAQPLFVDGNPTPLTQEALKFCGALHSDHMVTKEFSAALVAENLLVDQVAKAVSESGRHYDVHGFRIVDTPKLFSFPDAKIVEWHKKGWLGLVHAHLSSMLGWKDLLARAGTNEVANKEEA